MSLPCTFCKIDLSSTQHEEICKFRPIKCLVSRPESCDWLDSENKLFDHCTLHHPSQVLTEYPLSWTHDINKPCDMIFITQKYELLILIHIKVCPNTRKLYHNVQCTTNRLKVNNLIFKLQIPNDNDKLLKTGDILPYDQTLLTEKNASSVECDLNSSTFTMTFDLKQFTCIVCGLTTNNDLNDNKYCPACFATITPCDNAANGCDYIDNKKKLIHHNQYFCNFSKWCRTCEKEYRFCPMRNNHYDAKHKNVTFDSDTFWLCSNVKFPTRGDFNFILKTRYGNFFGIIFQFANYLIQLYSPLNTEFLLRLKCILSIKNGDRITSVPLNKPAMICSFVWEYELATELLPLSSNCSLKFNIYSDDDRPAEMACKEQNFTCLTCEATTNYELNENKYCDICFERLEACRHSKRKRRKCDFIDLFPKSVFHEDYYCKFSKLCFFCPTKLSSNAMETNHYETEHQNSTFDTGEFWLCSTINFRNSGSFNFILSSPFGIFLCSIFSYSEDGYKLEICSHLLNETLVTLKCIIFIKNDREIIRVRETKTSVTASEAWGYFISTDTLSITSENSYIKIFICSKDDEHGDDMLLHFFSKKKIIN